MTPSELIKAARTHAGLTQTKLAVLLEVSQARVCEWEKGKKDPSASTLLKILEVCNHKIK